MTKQLSGAMQKLACLVLDSVSRAASLGDLLLAPVCPIEKVTLWVSFLCLTSGSEIDEGVTKEKVLPELGIEPGLRVQSLVRYPLGNHFMPITTVSPRCTKLGTYTLFTF